MAGWFEKTCSRRFGSTDWAQLITRRSHLVTEGEQAMVITSSTLLAEVTQTVHSLYPSFICISIFVLLWNLFLSILLKWFLCLCDFFVLLSSIRYIIMKGVMYKWSLVALLRKSNQELKVDSLRPSTLICNLEFLILKIFGKRRAS